MKDEKVLSVTEAVTLATKAATAAGISQKEIFRLYVLMHRAAKKYVSEFGRIEEIREKTENVI